MASQIGQLTSYQDTVPDKRMVTDRILRIDAPDARVREAYFARKVPDLSPADVAKWVELTDGLPFAALAEMVISVCCLGNDLEEAAKLLKALDAHNPSSLEFANSAPENGDGAPDNTGNVPF